jgi:pyruvate/2-oxoglutarate dehydrogenase complex dihydrolipoamide dehydrogenase (E3) component
MVATGSAPLWPPIEGLGSARCVDSVGLLSQKELPERLVILGGGVVGREFASILQRFGPRVTIIEMAPSLIPVEGADAGEETRKEFRKRGVTLRLGTRCTKVQENGSEMSVHYGD